MCLNLRSDCVGAEQTWLDHASVLLRYAREKGWCVAHAHCHGNQNTSAGPLSGLEPLISEPVFSVQGFSAFENDSFREWAGQGRLYVIGCVFGLAGAATVVGAQVFKIELTLIPEACGAAPEGAGQEDDQRRVGIAALTRTVAITEVVGRRRLGNVVRLAQRRAKQGDGGK